MSETFLLPCQEAKPCCDALIDPSGFFKPTNVWLMLLLSIGTLSAYIPYWLYSRTRLLNSAITPRISPVFTSLALFVYATAVILILGKALIAHESPQWSLVLGCAFLANNLLLVWALLFYSRLSSNVLGIQTKRSADLIRAVVLSIFFMQSKINQAIEENSY